MDNTITSDTGTGTTPKQFLQLLTRFAVPRVRSTEIHNRRTMDTRDRICGYSVMSYMQQGTSLVRIGDAEYNAGPGQLILIPEYTRHDHVIEDPHMCTFLWWHFNYRLANEVDLVKLLRMPVVTTVKDRDAFEKLFLEFYELAHSTPLELATQLRAQAKSLEVMAQAIEEIFGSEFIQQLRLDVPNNFLSMFADITRAPASHRDLRALEENYHLSRTYITNRFKHYFGVTPVRLSSHLLVEQANVMLSANKYRIVEIAERLGFGDVSSFSRFYRRETGMPPSSRAMEPH